MGSSGAGASTGSTQAERSHTADATPMVPADDPMTSSDVMADVGLDVAEDVGPDGMQGGLDQGDGFFGDRFDVDFVDVSEEGDAVEVDDAADESEG
jgi:hypothetical protein